jgi:hypothetical protein
MEMECFAHQLSSLFIIDYGCHDVGTLGRGCEAATLEKNRVIVVIGHGSTMSI